MSFNKNSASFVLLCSLAFSSFATGQTLAQESQPAKDPSVDAVFAQEKKLSDTMRKFSPIVETYIQNFKPDEELGAVPESDQYFLGRLVLNKKLVRKGMDKQNASFFSRTLDRLDSFYKLHYVPLGFTQLVLLNHDFDARHYQLKYQRQQFLGEVRTRVYDVEPAHGAKGTHFLGRIWVEDQSHNIVRINGTYAPQKPGSMYLHFDTWRLNVQPDLWVPAFVYTEETDAKYNFTRNLHMKSQTRLWGYDRKHSGQQSEFTDLQVDSASSDIADKSGSNANESSPLRSQHMWEREAEDNILDRMERAGVLGPAGEASKVLETVVNNLEVTNNIAVDPEVRCRVLLTTPLESFNVGHTIVVSRGLLDVLPDEASLAMVLSHELAHIALGHAVNTKYAFNDRMLFPDEKVIQKIGVQRTDPEEEAADKKALELLAKSPYKDKLQNAGLFLRALESRSHELPALINPNFGNRMAKSDEVLRLGSLAQSAPQLQATNVHQMAALPLGGRINLNPWNDQVTLQKGKPVPLLAAREKMPFEVTPFFPNLARLKEPTSEVASQSKASGDR
jgi:hypothetical protein